MRHHLHVSERRACAALGQHRSTQRRLPRGREDEERLTADIIELARLYGRYGYRKIAALLRDAGWLVNDKRVERIWLREGLKVPSKQPKRGRLWLNDGSCIRLRPEHRDHVWSYDFVEDRTHDGRKYRMLNVVDEFTHECLAIRINRKLKAFDVIDVLSDLFILRGVPGHVRSDNGPEFVAKAVRDWIALVGAKTAYTEPGSPWENGYCESFNSKLRDELLNGEIFYSLREASRHMRSRAQSGDPGGSIVVTGSLSIFHGIQGMEHYAGAKGALAAMVKGLAVELGQFDVRGKRRCEKPYFAQVRRARRIPGSLFSQPTFAARFSEDPRLPVRSAGPVMSSGSGSRRSTLPCHMASLSLAIALKIRINRAIRGSRPGAERTVSAISP